MEKYRETKLGKKMAMDFYKKAPDYTKDAKLRLKDYRIGSDKKVDKALEALYLDVVSFDNACPLRIRIEQGVSNLEKVLLK